MRGRNDAERSSLKFHREERSLLGNAPWGWRVVDCAVNSTSTLDIFVGLERRSTRIPLTIDGDESSLCVRCLPEKSTSLR